MKKRKFIAMLVSAFVLCSCTALAGCGSETGNESTKTSESSSAESKADSGQVMSEVAEKLSASSGNPEFFASDFGEVDISAALSGKKIMVVAYDSTNDWCVNYAKMADAVYKKVGASSDINYCDGTTDSWISAIQTGINQGYDAIDLFGISDIGQLQSVIDEAKAAGVYIQDTHGTDISDDSSNTDCSIGCDYAHAGELMALQTISEIGDPSKVNCLVVADVGWGADTNVRNGITGVFDEYGCKYTVADVSITDWTEGIGNAVRNAFVADSSYNAVIAFYDNMCLYVVPALEELGISKDDVVVGSFNGNPGLIDYVASGNMDYDLGESIGWCACHAADCMARNFAGQEVHNKSGFAMYFITTDNSSDYIDPSVGKASYSYDGVQDIYLKGYSELWGVDMTGVFASVE